MKKIIVIFTLCLLFACNIWSKPNTFSLTDYFDSGILHIYTLHPVNETSIQLSTVYISSNIAGATSKDIIGESLYFTNLEVGTALNTLKAKVKFTEYIEHQSLTIIYAYSTLVPLHKMINDVKVNIQISSCNEYCVVGWPVIYGSF